MEKFLILEVFAGRYSYPSEFVDERITKVPSTRDIERMSSGACVVQAGDFLRLVDFHPQDRLGAVVTSRDAIRRSLERTTPGMGGAS